MGMFQIRRHNMVNSQLVARGIVDPLVLDAMRQVPRHLFVAEALQSQAYEDYPLPIGHGQTISQPFVVAVMSQLLEAQKGMRVLEIGTGSGYQAAVLHNMGLEVYTVERIQELYLKTSKFFVEMRYRGIRIKLADGTVGWPEAGPFDRIIVTAGGPYIPEPLVEQLADNGIMIIPIGQERKGQHLVCVKKCDGVVSVTQLSAVSFVDLVGTHGW